MPSSEPFLYGVPVSQRKQNDEYRNTQQEEETLILTMTYVVTDEGQQNGSEKPADGADEEKFLRA